MRKKGNLYEYIAVYVDDLAIAMRDPKELTDILEKQHKFKLKGTGPISFDITCTLITTNSRQQTNNQPAKATIASCYGDGAVSMLLTMRSKLNCAYYTLLYY
jgi:hypothetical protein